MLLLCLFYLCVDVKHFYWYHTVYNFINSKHSFLLYFSKKCYVFKSPTTSFDFALTWSLTLIYHWYPVNWNCRWKLASLFPGASTWNPQQISWNTFTRKQLSFKKSLDWVTASFWGGKGRWGSIGEPVRSACHKETGIKCCQELHKVLTQFNRKRPQ
jgi:hypothetical protein